MFSVLCGHRKFLSFRTLQMAQIAALHLCEILETLCDKYGIPMQSAARGGRAAVAAPSNGGGGSSAIVTVERVQRMLATLTRLVGIDLSSYGVAAEPLMDGDA